MFKSVDILCDFDEFVNVSRFADFNNWFSANGWVANAFEDWTTWFILTFDNKFNCFFFRSTVFFMEVFNCLSCAFIWVADAGLATAAEFVSYKKIFIRFANWFDKVKWASFLRALAWFNWATFSTVLDSECNFKFFTHWAIFLIFNGVNGAGNVFAFVIYAAPFKFAATVDIPSRVHFFTFGAWVDLRSAWNGGFGDKSGDFTVASVDTALVVVGSPPVTWLSWLVIVIDTSWTFEVMDAFSFEEYFAFWAEATFNVEFDGVVFQCCCVGFHVSACFLYSWTASHVDFISWTFVRAVMVSSPVDTSFA
jgi:hypothetical protein